MTSQQEIFELLQKLTHPSASYNADQARIQELWKSVPGYLVELQAIAVNPAVPTPERTLASLISGRELKTRWRSRIIVPDELKPQVRERLFAALEEEESAIAKTQLSLLVAIGRIDYPKAWQNLPQLLLHSLQTSYQTATSPERTPKSLTSLYNSIWTLNAFIKEWRAVRVPLGVQAMLQFANIFIPTVQGIVQQATEGEWQIQEAARYGYKILARFATYYWGKAKGQQTDEMLNFIRMVLQHGASQLPILHARRLALLEQPSPDPRTLVSVTKYIRVIGKWMKGMLQTDGKNFVSLPETTEAIGWWWSVVGQAVRQGEITKPEFGETPNVSNPKQFLLLGMMLFKDLLPYLITTRPEIFTPTFVLESFHLLVDHLLPLTPSDLEQLEESPEEWLIQMESGDEAWQYELRPCAERVLMALNNACRNVPQEAKVLEVEVAKALAQVEAGPPNDLDNIIRREAVYDAMGCMSRSLVSFGNVDFTAFLQRASAWVGGSAPLLRIIKRRLAILIGVWVSADEEIVKDALVWQILMHLLSERGNATDMAVQLCAANAVKEGVDLWELEISYFSPYLQQTMEQLTLLLNEAETLGGKRIINRALSVVIERCGDHTRPYLPAVASAIPILWQSSSTLEGEWLFKATLVLLTTKIVEIARDASGQLMELVVPLIEESLRMPAKAVFEEDGIALWQAALRNSTSLFDPSAEKGLVRLLHGALEMLSNNLDLFKSVRALVFSYLLLDANYVVQTEGETLFVAIRHCVSNGSTEAVKLALGLLSEVVRAVPLSNIAPLLSGSGVFSMITKSLEDEKQSGLVLAAHLEVLARIMLTDPNIFLQLVQQDAVHRQQTEEVRLDAILDATWASFDYAGESRQRKVIAMAMASLLPTGHHLVLERLRGGEILNVLIDVLGELQVSVENGDTEEPAARGVKEGYAIGLNDPEAERFKSFEEADPALRESLKDFIKSRFNMAAQGPTFNECWSRADEGARVSFERFLAQ